MSWLQNFTVSIFPETDPWTNLALEEVLFDHLSHGAPRLIFYVNSPCIVIGKHQNPWKEVKTSRAREKNIPIIRRSSGGGTVVHDLGNLNFSFLCPKDLYDRPQLYQFFTKTLGQLGWSMTITDKGDFLMNGRKFSGQAYTFRQDSVLHHGTLLVNADLERLRGLLGCEEEITDWVGVPSRPMSVINLCEFDSKWTAQSFAQALSSAALTAGARSSTELEMIARASPDFSVVLDRLKSGAWTWGETPPFTWTGAGRSLRIEGGRAPGEEIWFDPRHYKTFS